MYIRLSCKDRSVLTITEESFCTDCLCMTPSVTQDCHIKISLTRFFADNREMRRTRRIGKWTRARRRGFSRVLEITPGSQKERGSAQQTSQTRILWSNTGKKQSEPRYSLEVNDYIVLCCSLTFTFATFILIFPLVLSFSSLFTCKVVGDYPQIEQTRVIIHRNNCFLWDTSFSPSRIGNHCSHKSQRLHRQVTIGFYFFIICLKVQLLSHFIMEFDNYPLFARSKELKCNVDISWQSLIDFVIKKLYHSFVVLSKNRQNCIDIPSRVLTPSLFSNTLLCLLLRDLTVYVVSSLNHRQENSRGKVAVLFSLNDKNSDFKRSVKWAWNYFFNSFFFLLQLHLRKTWIKRKINIMRGRETVE
jgi:hypothetical protein